MSEAAVSEVIFNPLSWQRVCSVDDIPMLEGRNVTIAGTRIAIFRTPNGFRALQAACPHKAGPLADGIVADNCVQCPLHGWEIDLSSGSVVRGGEGQIPTYEIAEHDDAIWLSLDSVGGI